MPTPIAATRPSAPTGGTPRPTPSPADDRARVERMLDAVRRLGAQLEATHRTLDVVVDRLSDAAHGARPAGSAAPAGPASRAARPAVGTPVRRPDPALSAGPARPGPPAGLPADLADHVRAPGGAPDGPVAG